MAVALAGCGDDTNAGGDADTGTPTGGSAPAESEGGPDTSGTASPTTAADTSDTHTDDADDAPVVFDLGSTPDAPGPPLGDVCTVAKDGRDVGTCQKTAPPDAFEPDVQWSWTGATLTQSFVTPLVGNLTDDNDDGVVDLCDIPDVVVVASSGVFGVGRIVVLSGDDGTLHFEIPVDVNLSVTPALGDIDGDGVIDIVALTGNLGVPGNLIAFDNQGNTKWTSASTLLADFAGPALADLDGDGTVEILMGGALYNADGVQQFDTGASAGNGVGSLVTAADLDDDGQLEIVHGAVAYRADGSLYYDAGILPGFPHIGNFDGDDSPEIIVMNSDGINLLEHDGTPIWLGQRPTGDPNTPYTVWLKPGTIHDFDGDGFAEFATGSANNYSMYEIDGLGATIVWQAPVLDISGSAGGTAFDFDGDGIAEAMYADETDLFVFDGMGMPLLTSPRESATGLEYPVVADVDNDGSAEIVVTSNSQFSGGGAGAPTVQVIRDVDDRWIPARRIWNQHTYHVSNVREDGTIPSVPSKSWLELNTFRTNAQFENGGICQPTPAG